MPHSQAISEACQLRFVKKAQKFGKNIRISVRSVFLSWAFLCWSLSVASLLHLQVISFTSQTPQAGILTTETILRFLSGLMSESSTFRLRYLRVC